MRDEVRESEAMMEENFCDKYRSGVVKERVICTEEDTEKRPTMELRTTKLRATGCELLREQEVWKKCGLISMAGVSVCI